MFSLLKYADGKTRTRLLLLSLGPFLDECGGSSGDLVLKRKEKAFLYLCTGRCTEFSSFFQLSEPVSVT